MVLFFSSRRRHTRLQGDWSSDVCSSDLSRILAARASKKGAPPKTWAPQVKCNALGGLTALESERRIVEFPRGLPVGGCATLDKERRISCLEADTTARTAFSAGI